MLALDENVNETSARRGLAQEGAEHDLDNPTQRATYERLVEEDLEPKRTSKKKGGAFAFSDTDAIKRKVRETQLGTPPYDVAVYYHKKGFFRWLATNSTFQNFTLCVIVLNALWMSCDTDKNGAATIFEAQPIFVAADVVFFTYFVMELSVRYLAFENKLNCFKDGWFSFDAFLVLLYAFDPFFIGLMTAISGQSAPDLPTSVLRLFRLARLSRLVRMLRSFPQLMTMIKGMGTAAASVGYTLALLMVITYVFAIAFRNSVDAESTIEDTYFPSVWQSIISLVIFGTFLDALSDFLLDVQKDSTPCFILCWIYISLASLTVMNMLIGVLCEVITAVAAEETESEAVQQINEKFEKVAERTSTPHSLTWVEFQQVLEDPGNVQSLREVGVDPESLIDLSHDYFFVDGSTNSAVSVEEFLEMVLDARGGQSATVKDLMHLGKRFRHKFTTLTKRTDQMCEMLDELLEPD